jgi:hypothetical protein
MILTKGDLELLKQLTAAGGRGCIIHEFNTRVALQRLAKGCYVIARTGDDGLRFLSISQWPVSKSGIFASAPPRSIYVSLAQPGGSPLAPPDYKPKR